MRHILILIGLCSIAIVEWSGCHNYYPEYSILNSFDYVTTHINAESCAKAADAIYQHEDAMSLISVNGSLWILQGNRLYRSDGFRALRIVGDQEININNVCKIAIIDGEVMGISAEAL